MWGPMKNCSPAKMVAAQSADPQSLEVSTAPLLSITITQPQKLEDFFAIGAIEVLAFLAMIETDWFQLLIISPNTQFDSRNRFTPNLFSGRICFGKAAGDDIS